MFSQPDVDTTDSLALMSQTGGQHDYGIQINANHGIVFVPGNKIELTIQTGNGMILSGVLAGPVASVREPRTLVLWAGGFIALVAIKRRCF